MKEGGTQSEETKRKISESRMGHGWTDEALKNLKDAQAIRRDRESRIKRDKVSMEYNSKVEVFRSSFPDPANLSIEAIQKANKIMNKLYFVLFKEEE